MSRLVRDSVEVPSPLRGRCARIRPPVRDRSRPPSSGAGDGASTAAARLRLFTRLEASFDAQRHFVANASHELRTPLAGLRTLLDVTLADADPDPDPDAATLRSACQEPLALGGHQEHLVQALLTLATSERGFARRDTVDLAQAVTGVLSSRRGQAADRGIDLAGQLTPAVTASDQGLIESLIANLIDNAIRHNHPDGHVEITTRDCGTRVSLTITNSGPVIPGNQIQRLFQPFQRLAPDRNGYGLGLAIVNAVTQAHHATLTASPRPEGGLSITLRFARAPGSRSCSTGRASTDSSPRVVADETAVATPCQQ